MDPLAEEEAAADACFLAFVSRDTRTLLGLVKEKGTALFNVHELSHVINAIV